MPQSYVPPLHVHVLCRDSASEPARAASKALGDLFQGNPLLHAVSPLDIPTFMVPVGLNGPGAIPWGDAQRHAIVVFLDDEMYDELRWGPWLEQLVKDADIHRALVLGVTADAGSVGNLSPRLAGKQLIRVPTATSGTVAATGETTAEAWTSEVALRVLRALASQLSEPGERDGRLFLSHAKADGLWLAEALRDLLAHREDGLAFFDGVALRPGDDFDASLQAGFDGAVVVALVTDLYSSRYWCLWEVANGKRRGCPFLAVDLLTEGEVRSLRYGGNARSMRWPIAVPADAAARVSWADDVNKVGEKRRVLRAIVQGALSELLRARHDRAHIAAVRAAGVLPADAYILGGAAELATLPPFEAGRCWRVIHADPPLPLPERELITRVRPDVTVESLTEALAQGGHLRGDPPLRVALSISDAADLADRGLTKGHLDRLWSRMTLQLLLSGAALAYGGDLRTGGYTEQLRDLIMSLAGLQTGPSEQAVHCYLGWPTWTQIPPAEWRRYPRMIVRHVLQAPGGIAAVGPAPVPNWTDAAQQLAWTVSMRAMRERMAHECDARVLVGGQFRAVSPVPGLIDEVTTFLDLGKPVYLLGGFGGMTAVLARAVRGEAPNELTQVFQDNGGERTAIREAIDRAAASQAFTDGGVRDGDAGGRPIHLAPTDLPGILARLKATGMAGLRNGLDAAENERCFTTRDPTEAVSLVLRGLTRLRRGTV